MSDLTRLEIDAKFARLELEINGLRLEISRLHPIPLKSENKEFCKSIAERLEALEKSVSIVLEEHKETKCLELKKQRINVGDFEHEMD